MRGTLKYNEEKQLVIESLDLYQWKDGKYYKGSDFGRFGEPGVGHPSWGKPYLEAGAIPYEKEYPIAREDIKSEILLTYVEKMKRKEKPEINFTIKENIAYIEKPMNEEYMVEIYCELLSYPKEERKKAINYLSTVLNEK